MATGSGKTVVMAMLIAWQVINKVTYPQDTRFSKYVFVVAPGLTVKSRQQVLLPCQRLGVRPFILNNPDRHIELNDVSITSYYSAGFRKGNIRMVKRTRFLSSRLLKNFPFTLRRAQGERGRC